MPADSHATTARHRLAVLSHLSPACREQRGCSAATSSPAATGERRQWIAHGPPACCPLATGAKPVHPQRSRNTSPWLPSATSLTALPTLLQLSTCLPAQLETVDEPSTEEASSAEAPAESQHETKTHPKAQTITDREAARMSDPPISLISGDPQAGCLSPECASTVHHPATEIHVNRANSHNGKPL